MPLRPLSKHRQILVLSHRWLVFSLIKRKRLMRHGLPIEELHQEGYLGLCIAAQTYKPSIGRFTLHAYYTVWGRLTSYYRHELYHLGNDTQRDGERFYLQRVPNEPLASHDGETRDTILERTPDASPLPDARAAASLERWSMHEEVMRMHRATRHALRPIMGKLVESPNGRVLRRVAEDLFDRPVVNERRRAAEIGVSRKSYTQARRRIMAMLPAIQ